MKAMIEINSNSQRQPVITRIMLIGIEILGGERLASPNARKIAATGNERPGSSSSPESPAAKIIVAITAIARSDRVQSFLRVILLLLENVSIKCEVNSNWKPVISIKVAQLKNPQNF